MKKLSIGLSLLFMAAIFTFCHTHKKAAASTPESNQMRESALKEADALLDSGNTTMEDGVLAEKGGIKLSFFQNSPDFPEAQLKMEKPDPKKALMPGNIFFRYKVKDFELTKQTSGGMTCNCSNSDKGQHIHEILNNEPYIARYTDTFTQALKQGHYINLAFLSRSYHESVKGPMAYVLNQFNVGVNEKDIDLSGPLLFYSRPKGEYKGKETEKILLDFYLVNTQLSDNGNKVRATINGNEFMLTQWTGYSLTGMPMGENTIKLELVDKDGKVIPGPYNSVTRKITLKP